MRKLVVCEFLTVDGVMEAPETWQFDHQSEDAGDVTRNQILSSDAALLGRVTYETFAGYWPLQTHNEFGIADKLNSQHKYVVSSTLKTLDWNNSSLIKGNIVEEITKLKQESGGIIGLTGSAMLFQTLLEADLVDELQLMIYPVVLGHGKRLFKEGSTIRSLKLVESKSFIKGAVLLSYQLEKK